ncbi:Zn-ribbon domain-containing OB-fold protein [Metabacillus iocasae]|uniref:OB-fold protein n=1 Tax=Priestia iocasae TaxID=2291674 RepID=A0ABS2QVR5_9BACI|nr:OB-fold domain-containing protein [Metabacillus iocasae]MBM7703570.1 putative OB-fold protein [Metabacillus iocasae]
MEKILVYECANCEKKFVQRKWICSSCKKTEFQTKKVAGKGVVYSHTTIHISSNEFAHLTPYTIALIELESGLRVTGRLHDPVQIHDEVTCLSNEENQYVFVKK